MDARFLLKSLDLSISDIFCDYHRNYSACVMTGFLIATKMCQEPEIIPDVFSDLRKNGKFKSILNGFVVWMQTNDDENSAFPAFLYHMRREEKEMILNHIMNTVNENKHMSPLTFEALVFICNDPKMFNHCIYKINELLSIFVKACYREDDRAWIDQFMRLFAFLKGKSLYKFINFYNTNYRGLELVYILRSLRSVGVLDFKKIWRHATMIDSTMENYYSVRGLRRIARMIWKDLNHHAPFKHYEWKGEFGDFDNIEYTEKDYSCSDKACEILARSGHLAIIRTDGKRYILMNSGNKNGIILPCKSKIRDSQLILANMII